MIIAATKFTHGAWVVVLLIPCLVALFYSIHGHYVRVGDQLRVESPPDPLVREDVGKVIVPVASLNKPVIRTLSYARGLSSDVTAVHVAEDLESAEGRENMLHNQTALRLKLALLSRPNTVVTDVPYHLLH